MRQWVVMRLPISPSAVPLPPSHYTHHLYQRSLLWLHYPYPISRRPMQTSSKPHLVSLPSIPRASSSLPPPAPPSPPPPPANALSSLTATTTHSTYSTTASSSSSPYPPPLEPPDHLDTKELEVFRKLASELSPSRLDVQDVSGGCGSMYAIEIASPKFKGLTIMKQHRLVQSILAEEIKGWHGVQLRTKTE